MCFSEKISWSTLILGTIFNIFSIFLLSCIQNNKRVIVPIMLIIGWQYSLLMQIPDALAWKDLKSKFPGKLAFCLNITQPIVMIIITAVMLHKLDRNLKLLIPLLFLALFYTVMVIKKSSQVNFDLTPEISCNNLSYRWWNGGMITIFYYVIIIICAFLIPSIPFIFLSLFLFVTTVIVSNIVVRKGCNIGSLWCWSVSLSGFITGIVGLIMNKLKIL
jgi:hypothetical protein